VPPDVANATAAPIPITREVLDRGQDLFETYCAACHGLTGEGDGMVARRGFRTPPAYHVQRLREAPIGHFVDVITNGWGAMPTYGYLVRPRDRWAVAAYIRTLQLSRAVPLDTLPRGVREALAGVPPPPPPQPQRPSRPPGQEPR
jgi:mono/diheme cytochrome c family protein